MKKFVKQLFLLILLAALYVPCAQAAGQSPSTDAKPKEVKLSGKILETVDGGGYTYILLQNDAEKVWVAIPLTKVTVGQQVSLVPGFEMKNFTSKGLNKKFDKVIFSAGLANNEKIHLSPSAMKMAHQGVPAAPGAEKSAPLPPPTRAAAAKNQKVIKAKGPNAFTVAELFAKRSKLEKKQVVVRGRVTQIAEKIMKKNWVHIEDGTGSKSKKTNQVVVTTKQLPKEGEVVTVTGTLYNNINLGSGYRYDVLIQDAKLK